MFSEAGIAREISGYFTFEVPGHQFMPAFQNKMWDGRIRLFNMNDFTLYAGLLQHLEKFAHHRDYTVAYEDNIAETTEFSVVEALEFIKTLKLPNEPWEHQIDAFTHSVRKGRCLLLSPTGSGKSLIIYLLLRYFKGKKALIIVPTKSLVAQMYKDFSDYGVNEGWSSDDHVHQIMQGANKDTDMPIVVSTWQSLYKMPKEYFDQYDMIIGDECHQFKAKSLTGLMTKLTTADVRVGMTGSLDESLTHKLVLEGLFGRAKRVATTKELTDEGILAKLNIKAIVLKHPEDICRANARAKYPDEMDNIVSNVARNTFIRNLAISLKGNTLVLFRYVEKHGDILDKIIRAKASKGRKIFYVWGKTDVEAREEVRAIVENETDAIIIASVGVFSTGINIKNLHNVIFAHPGKSKIQTLQSIGRSLRKTSIKLTATLYDIVDDMTYKKYVNWSVKHFIERHKYYMQEEHPIKIYKVTIK